MGRAAGSVRRIGCAVLEGGGFAHGPGTLASSSTMSSHAFDLPPSAWVRQWTDWIQPGGTVLDLACGSGRHARLLARLGFEVDAVDRDIALFPDPPPGVTLLEADLEAGPWPYAGRRFAAIVVTNYLHRPLLPALVDC